MTDRPAKKLKDPTIENGGKTGALKGIQIFSDPGQEREQNAAKNRQRDWFKDANAKGGTVFRGPLKSNSGLKC